MISTGRTAVTFQMLAKTPVALYPSKVLAFRADAVLQALIAMRSSIKLSLTFSPAGCIMYTSFPLNPSQYLPTNSRGSALPDRFLDLDSSLPNREFGQEHLPVIVS